MTKQDKTHWILRSAQDDECVHQDDKSVRQDDVCVREDDVAIPFRLVHGILHRRGGRLRSP
jgi:hypothetical protein